MSDEYRERERKSLAWHRAVNAYHWPEGGAMKLSDRADWMYEARAMARESASLPDLFRREREGLLPKLHRQCSLSPTEPVTDNHLTCCLGVECRKCPQLLALESADLPPAEIDRAKAWTCVAHIVMRGGDPAKEGYILTTDDRMFWDRTYESMAADDPECSADTNTPEKGAQP